MQLDLGNVWCILVSGIFNVEAILVWWPCVHSLPTTKKSQRELLELWLCHLAAWHCSFVEWKTERGRWETDTFHDQISVLFPYEKWAFFLFVHFCTCIENRILTLCLKGKHQHPAFHLVFFSSGMLEANVLSTHYRTFLLFHDCGCHWQWKAHWARWLCDWSLLVSLSELTGCRTSSTVFFSYSPASGWMISFTYRHLRNTLIPGSPTTSGKSEGCTASWGTTLASHGSRIS